MFEFENKVDHIFTHRGPVEFVNKPSTFKSGIFGLNFLDHLFSETANFCGALNGHVFCTFVTAEKNVFSNWFFKSLITYVEVTP